MTNRRFPRYIDDADFTTNAPSYYEDLARKEKLIRLLAERIWGYEKILDDTLEEIQERFRAWDKNLEDFPDDVKVLLQQWLDDGTLDHIINDTIFNWKLDTSIFEQFRDTITAQLQQTGERIEGFVNVAEYGAVGDGVTDDTQAILNALSENKKVEFSRKTYVMSKRLILTAHILKGQFDGDTFSAENTTRILFKDMPSVESAVHVSSASQIDNILFELDRWTDNTPEINGLTANRRIVATNCHWNAFTGNGALLYRRESSPDVAPYHSNFTNCGFEYNKKHGLVLGNGMNSVTLINPVARWNGSPSYKLGPTVKSIYDGIHINGKIETLPAGLDFEPQGNLIIGGDISYNSQYGIHFAYGNDNTQIGGYLEGSLKNDIHVGNSYGTIIMNPVIPGDPSFTTLEFDPDNSARRLSSYPNHIVTRGRDYGNGRRDKNGHVYKNFKGLDLKNGPIFTANKNEDRFIFDSKWEGYGVNQAFLQLTDRVHLGTKSAVFGADILPTKKGVHFYPKDDWESSQIFSLNGYDSTIDDTPGSGFYAARGNKGSSTITALRLAAHSETNRSINVGGTVNTSGADYAEYMYKDKPNDIIEKGEITGINSEGKLTREFDKAISFVVKSTNPSFVGGDTWAKNLPLEPSVPVRSEESDEEFEEKIATYNEEKQRFDELLESERRKVDRIAFSGICPVNIQGAVVGDYIIPEKDNNNIKGKAISNVTFEEYKIAVGRVISIGDDGRPIIIVKTI